jgi:hypothetical protein
VAPIEFTLRLSDYETLGGYMDAVRPLSSLQEWSASRASSLAGSPWPLGHMVPKAPWT